MLQLPWKRKILLNKAVVYIILAIVLFIFVFPIVWLFLISIKDRATIFTLPPPLFFEATASNYAKAFIEKGYIRYLANSLIVATGTTAIVLSVGPLAAFGFSRFKMLADKHLFFWILTFRMSPVIVFIIPFFIIWNALGLLDTYISIILAHSSMILPFAIWLMKGIFDDLPREYEEAAMVDGCSRLTAFRLVTLPLTAPALITSAIFSMIFSWNEYFFAMVLTGSRTRTMPSGITGFITTYGTLWGEMAAVGIIIIIPIIVLAIIIQKYLVRGFTFGAVK